MYNRTGEKCIISNSSVVLHCNHATIVLLCTFLFPVIRALEVRHGAAHDHFRCEQLLRVFRTSRSQLNSMNTPYSYKMRFIAPCIHTYICRDSINFVQEFRNRERV